MNKIINKFKNEFKNLNNFATIREVSTDIKHEAISLYIDDNNNIDQKDIIPSDWFDYVHEIINDVDPFHSSYCNADLQKLTKTFCIFEIEEIEDFVKNGYFSDLYSIKKEVGYESIIEQVKDIFHLFYVQLIIEHIEKNN